jgi:hypothetical protein
VPDISKPDDASGPSSGGPPFGPAPDTPPTTGWGVPPGAPPGSAPAGYGAPPNYGPQPGYAPQLGYGGAPGYGGPPGHGGYGPYGGPPPPAPGRPTNGNALASLILGVALFVVPCVAPVTSIIAVILGYKARREIEASGGYQDGAGLATAGIILGWIGVGLTVLGIVILVVVLVAAAASDSSSLGLVAALVT